MAVAYVSALSDVIERLRWDAGFRSQYCADPDQALAHYPLTPEELRVLKTGDGFELEAMGLGHKWDHLVAALCGPLPGP